LHGRGAFAGHSGLGQKSGSVARFEHEGNSGRNDCIGGVDRTVTRLEGDYNLVTWEPWQWGVPVIPKGTIMSMKETLAALCGVATGLLVAPSGVASIIAIALCSLYLLKRV
jgi:hypothetical protein